MLVAIAPKRGANPKNSSLDHQVSSALTRVDRNRILAKYDFVALRNPSMTDQSDAAWWTKVPKGGNDGAKRRAGATGARSFSATARTVSMSLYC